MNLIRPPLGGQARWGTASNARTWLAPTAIRSFSLALAQPTTEVGGKHCISAETNDDPSSKLIRRKGEKRSKERAMRVERNSATRRPKPRQDERQRAMRQSRLGTVRNLISLDAITRDLNLHAQIRGWFGDGSLSFGRHGTGT